MDFNLASLVSKLKDQKINDQINSVCAIILEDKEGLAARCFFIHRTLKVPTHKNQVALVGGHIKKGEDCLDAIAREIAEETALAINNFNYIGVSQGCYTATNHYIQPFVFSLKSDLFAGINSNGEWDKGYLYPLRHLQSSQWSYFENHMKPGNKKVLMVELIFKEDTEYFSNFNIERPQQFILWGATARIIWHFLALLDTKGKACID
jgi:8-oxo-dGTP pyrophosphatase MutT (NUDIX family)